jgi:hypothetical protein
VRAAVPDQSDEHLGKSESSQQLRTSGQENGVFSTSDADLEPEAPFGLGTFSTEATDFERGLDLRLKSMSIRS